MGVVGRLDQYASMLAYEFDETTANNPSITGLGTYYATEFNENIVDIVRDGLVLNLDAGNLASYSGTLIINGTFDSNVTGWTTTNSTNTWSSGKMQISRTGGDGRVSYQTFSTIVGQSYRVTSEVNSSGSRGDVYIYDGSGIGGTRFLSILGTNGQTLTLTGTFTAISTITTLGFGVDVDGTSIVVDNVSVSPILWTDVSGNNNNGTLTNGPTYSSANGSFLSFDGTDDYISFSSPLVVNTNTGFTIELLINISTTQSSSQWNYFYSDGISSWEIGSYGTSPGTFEFKDTGTGGTPSVSCPISSSWQHIVFGCNARQAFLYNNLNYTTNATLFRNGNISISNLNRSQASSSGYYRTNQGIIRIYNRALTAAEVQQNYNSIVSRYGLSTTSSTSPLSANVFAPYDPVYDEFSGTSFGAGQGRYMRQNTDKSVIVYNEIDEVTDFYGRGNIVRDDLILDLDAGISASYPGLGTTWTDLSSNNTKATIVGDQVAYSSINSGVFNFTGGGGGDADHISIPNTSVILGANFTIEVWNYYNTASPPPDNPWQAGLWTNSATADWNGGAGNNNGLVFGYNAMVYVNTSASQVNITYSTNPASRVWHQHVLVVNSGVGTVYVDRSIVATLSNVRTYTQSNGTLAIGVADIFGGYRGEYFGYISNVKIYKKALTREEITQNYNALRGRFGL